MPQKNLPNIYNGDGWTVELPQKWIAEETDGCTSFYDETTEGVGALQMSWCYRDDRVATQEDVWDFMLDECSANGIDAKAVSRPALAGSFCGREISLVRNEYKWRMWWLVYQNALVFVTYNCLQEHEGKESSRVEAILASLRTD